MRRRAFDPGSLPGVALAALVGLTAVLTCCVSMPAALPATTTPPHPMTPKSGELRADPTDLARWDAATPHARRAVAEDVARREPDFTLLRLETFTCGGQTHDVAIYAHARTGLEFVLVPCGTFAMGSPASDSQRFGDELQHEVTLTKPFLVCRTECTQAAYLRVTGEDPSRFKGPQSPVEMVSWEESKAFCDAAGLQLPSEAQWEWACRAGTTTRWNFGDDEAQLAGAVWYGQNSDRGTRAVAQKPPNAFGLYDMHGNVWEWCADWWADYPAGSVTDPVGPEDGQFHAYRGAGWDISARCTRSAVRFRGEAGTRIPVLGFRPTKTVPMEGAARSSRVPPSRSLQRDPGPYALVALETPDRRDRSPEHEGLNDARRLRKQPDACR